jgi:GNAT superfamily N-acetyltransferase
MVSIRPAEQKDAAEAVDVVRRSISELCVLDHRNDPDTLHAWLANKTEKNFLTWISNPDNFCVIAEADGRLLGVGDLHRRGEILLFYLRPGTQRQGFGRMIHDVLAKQASEWELKSLYLESTAMARPFYASIGYRPAGEPVARFGVLESFPYVKQL